MTEPQSGERTGLGAALGRPVVRTAICISVFICAFVVTHLPPPDQPIAPLEHDKILHMTGFTVLGALVLWRLGAIRSRLPLVAALPWYAGLLCYGAFDELTQPITGRSCELFDWFADAAGGAIGMSLVILTFQWWVRASRSE